MSGSDTEELGQEASAQPAEHEGGVKAETKEGDAPKPGEGMGNIKLIPATTKSKGDMGPLDGPIDEGT